MTNIDSGQSTMARAGQCLHGYAVVHRISRRSHSYGRSFSCCPIHWEDPENCRFFSWDPPDLPRDEPGAQAPVKQYSPTASASSFQNLPLPEECPAASSTGDVSQVASSSRKRARTGLDFPLREYGRPSPPPSKTPATAQSEFKPARPVISEEVFQDALDALPIIPIYVDEMKHQILTLQESNKMMESRIQQLEKQLGETEKWRGCG